MRSMIAMLLFLVPCIAMAADAPCKMRDQAYINVSFNNVEPDIANVKSKFEAKIKEIETLAKQAKLNKFEVQSMSYNVSSNNYGNGSNQQYQFSGNVNFAVDPADKGTDLMELLTKKGYQANLNVNSFREGPRCANANMPLD